MKTTVIILSVIVVIETLLIIVFGGRMLHDMQKKKLRTNTFAMQNAGTGMDIRVYNAGIADETKIIIYPHHNWECMTWQMIEQDDGSYLLKNLYTEKGFEPSESPAEGVTLWQQTLSAKEIQSWIFEEINGQYRIRLKDTDLYLTAETDKTNANLILMFKAEDKKQFWTLIPQQPIM
jgi:hypothetical protein